MKNEDRGIHSGIQKGRRGERLLIRLENRDFLMKWYQEIKPGGLKVLFNIHLDRDCSIFLVGPQSIPF